MPRDPVQLDTTTTAKTDEPVWLCHACGTHVTRPAWAITPDGEHERVFFNPYGHLFRVLCFGAAPGVTDATPPESGFSWFPGYAWTIAICRGCGDHLGWRYQGDGRGDGAPPVFFGLIKSKLVASADGVAGGMSGG